MGAPPRVSRPRRPQTNPSPRRDRGGVDVEAAGFTSDGREHIGANLRELADCLRDPPRKPEQLQIASSLKSSAPIF